MTGFRVKAPILNALGQMKRSITAGQFEPEVMRFLQKSLTTAMKNTPVRDVATINKNQRKQYKRRLNYIPSYFDTQGATLIFDEDSNEQWLRVDGQWYRPDIWDIPDDIYSIYQGLLAERMRRDEKAQSDFIKERSQARYLYKRSWYEIGQSAGVSVRGSKSVINSRSRHNPPKTPRKGYVQKRGGKNTFSVVVYNPFLETQSKYKFFSGKELIDSAMNLHRPAFKKEVSAKSTKLILKLLKLST